MKTITCLAALAAAAALDAAEIVTLNSFGPYRKAFVETNQYVRVLGVAQQADTAAKPGLVFWATLEPQTRWWTIEPGQVMVGWGAVDVDPNWTLGRGAVLVTLEIGTLAELTGRPAAPAPAATITVQSSTNLVSWRDVQTLQVPSPGDQAAYRLRIEGVK
jgi:hypothetical protein